jgi:hypothetical protein
MSTELSSNTPDYRNNLRRSLLQQLQRQGYKGLNPTILDLSHPPSAPGWSISLSHCPQACLMAIATKEVLVGVDIEVTQRIQPQIVARVASTEELDHCPDYWRLFTAKEAAWKALNSQYPTQLMSHIGTLDWHPINKGLWTFKLQIDGKNLDGYGFSLDKGDLNIACYFQDSTFVPTLR